MGVDHLNGGNRPSDMGIGLGIDTFGSSLRCMHATFQSSPRDAAVGDQKDSSPVIRTLAANSGQVRGPYIRLPYAADRSVSPPISKCNLR